VSIFLRYLRERQPSSEGRRWIFVPYDQLTDGVGPLSEEDPHTLGIIVVESRWKAARRPYHKQKLALILANLRHFALEQSERGVAVRHLVADGPYRSVLEPVIAEVGPLCVMKPAERELRVDLEPLVTSGGLTMIPHRGWLTDQDQFASSKRNRGWRMDAFYRTVRRATGFLMVDGAPEGGKFSFDAENRRRWDGKPAAPAPLSFPRDPIKEEVVSLVQREFSRHPGNLNIDRLPATRQDAETMWQWALERCLPLFGPYEDAMSMYSPSLFHTRISGLLNMHRLVPSRIIRDVIAADVPLSSKEGFLRQVIGWREFVHHVHDATDGFRNLSGEFRMVTPYPGDGGFRRWGGKAWVSGREPGSPDGGAAPSYLGADRSLPPAFWGERSGLHCLDRVVSDVWRDGYSHHITRLMVLSNIASLLEVSPRELTDWFWAAYTDAYDWVVEPNVLGMGTFAVGDLITTKPYISGAAYINRMGDYCAECVFDPEVSCPLTPLYWAYLDRHAEILRRNPRLRVMMASLGRRSLSQRQRDQQVYTTLSQVLTRGERVTPENLP